MVEENWAYSPHLPPLSTKSLEGALKHQTAVSQPDTYTVQRAALALESINHIE